MRLSHRCQSAIAAVAMVVGTGALAQEPPKEPPAPQAPPLFSGGYDELPSAAPKLRSLPAGRLVEMHVVGPSDQMGKFDVILDKECTTCVGVDPTPPPVPPPANPCKKEIVRGQAGELAQMAARSDGKLNLGMLLVDTGSASGDTKPGATGVDPVPPPVPPPGGCK